LASVLRAAVVGGPELIRGTSDRVPLASLQQQSAAASLALIAPDDLNLYHQLSYRGRPQARGRFSLGTGQQTIVYDLVVTDPHWENETIQRGPRTLRQTDAKYLMTISLGEPLGLYCYKLIAAIIPLPPSITTAF
jgi:hypothetical protein